MLRTVSILLVFIFIKHNVTKLSDIRPYQKDWLERIHYFTASINTYATGVLLLVPGDRLALSNEPFSSRSPQPDVPVNGGISSFPNTVFYIDKKDNGYPKIKTY
jgi:hypothetical protein